MKRVVLNIVVYAYIGTDISISEQSFDLENDTPHTKNHRYEFV